MMDGEGAMEVAIKVPSRAIHFMQIQSCQSNRKSSCLKEGFRSKEVELTRLVGPSENDLWRHKWNPQRERRSQGGGNGSAAAAMFEDRC